LTVVKEDNLDIEFIKQFYQKFEQSIKNIKHILNKPLTLSEKILLAHLYEKEAIHHEIKRGSVYLEFAPDRVAMQDATAQMALLQFIQTGKAQSAVPATIHCDHLIQACDDAETDLKKALNDNAEVYNFLSAVAAKYNLGFWKPGAGIIHQIVFENYAFPGGMMVGTDSHTPTAGGLGMIAIGVGGADAVDVLVGLPWELKFPKIMGIKLTGKLQPWVTPKDIILKLAGMLTVKGGTGFILEYFGEGVSHLSATGKSTICNMGAEIGATTSIFPYDEAMKAYLIATHRESVAQLADQVKMHLNPDPEVLADPSHFFDELIEIDLNTLEPYINGPFTPDKAIPLSQFAEFIQQNQYPSTLSAGLMGSCTNSSFEDLTSCADLLNQAMNQQCEIKSQLYVSPGSIQIYKIIDHNQVLDTFQKANAKIFTNACGPCIGQWQRTDISNNQENSIMTTFNRNFAKRNDGNPNTFAFVASPEMVTAFSIAGSLLFNPLTDTIKNKEGNLIKLTPPQSSALTASQYPNLIEGLGDAGDSNIEIKIDPNSVRLQLLAPFPAWDHNNILNAALLIKVKGKCTTDHISMAGPWLKYRGHLDKISDNLLMSAVNAFNDQQNSVKNQKTGIYDAVSSVARFYKKEGIKSIVIGEENYGEGSSREHAAMEPRYLGVVAIIVKSFARIHETNLKKQGMLALTFKNKDDYDKIKEDDQLDIIGLDNFNSTSELKLIDRHSNGSIDEILLLHTYNDKQICWFKAGSALHA